MEWLALFALFAVLIRTRSTIAGLKEELEKQGQALLDLRNRLDGESRAARARASEPVKAGDATIAPLEFPRPAVVRQPSAAPAPVLAAPQPGPVMPPGSGRPSDRITVPPTVAAASVSVGGGVPPIRPPLQPPAPPASPPPRAPSRPAPPPPPESPSFDWESLIGVKLFSWVAGAALALAAIFFLRYSLDAGWLRPEIRMAIGLATGIALLVGCELKAARRYAQTANALDASGIAILFATVFASFALWHLVPPTIAFAMLIIVTAVAVLLSIRRGSMFIAVLGLLGGFAAPVMLSTGQDNPIGLFSYLLLLNAGLAWVAYRKQWPALTALSVVFTTLYQWGWVVKFLNADKLPTAIGVFLIFPVLTFVALAIGGGRAEANDEHESVWFSSSLFRAAARASAALPLLFSLYLAAVPAYGAHFGLLFGFLFLIVVGLFVLAIAQGPQLLHFLGALSTVVVFGVWFKGSYTAAAWPWILGIVAAFVLFYLTAPLLARVLRDEILGDLGARAAFAAPLLLFAFPVLLAIEPRAASPYLPFGVLFALLAACAVFAVRRAEGAVHYLAAFFAVAAEAVWSARYLDAEQLYPALGLYALFGLFYVGAPVVARRLKTPFEPKGAAGLLTLVSLALLFFVAAGPVAQSALWGMALLIAVLNVGLMHEASYSRMPLFSLLGAGLSWALLAVWWFTVGVAAMIVPALVVMGGFALLTLGGNVVARRRAEEAGEAETSGFDANVFAALVGHVFVAFVATRPELSIPPWPVLGVLLVLDLAVLAAALLIRRGGLQLAVTTATAVVLGLWVVTARVAPWPMVAILAAGASTLIAFVALPLAARVGVGDGLFTLSAAVAALLAQVVTLIAQAQPGSPGLSFLLGAQLVLVAAALSLSWIDAEHLGWASVAAVLPAGVSSMLWILRHDTPTDWVSQLTMSTPLFLVFVAYPLLLGRRVKQATLPYASTVLASVAYFFLARHSLMLGGYASVIGALPVAMAIVLAPVLAQLVRLERDAAVREKRKNPLAAIATDRLALVAAAVLAFVTVAIPLQLDRNWITIGWALEGAALLWLVRRIPHAGLLAAATALLVTTFVRLSLNPAVLTYHPRGAMPVLNWYLYTYLLCAAALFLSAWLVRGVDVDLLGAVGKLSALFSAGGTVLLFLLLNIEIADFYAVGQTITFNFNANLAQDLTYTLGWAVFAIAVLAAGIIARNRSARLASIVLLVITVLKCFLHDLARLGGLYRVGSFVGLALALALVAIVIQKFVLARDEPTPVEGRA